jgi:hypothetical protein
MFPRLSFKLVHLLPKQEKAACCRATAGGVDLFFIMQNNGRQTPEDPTK